MSEAQSSRKTDNPTAHDLTAFQQRILVILSEEPEYGLAIKNDLEEYYGSDVNHGRLYPNLDDLVEQGLITKSERDKRTNEYSLTEEGYNHLLGQLDWAFSKVVNSTERADDISQLLKKAA